jgi:hypothetical protein
MARPYAKRSLAGAAMLVLSTLSVRAQQPARPPQASCEKLTPPSTHVSPTAADPKDVASQDAIIAALYDVISGPACQARDWDRFRSLFVPGARLIPTGFTSGKAVTRVMTPDEYATASGANLERNGFFEKEISRTGETFGAVTHAFSTYESRRKANDEKPFARGINSIQLSNDGTRWWIVTVYWQGERPDSPIPAQYLKPPAN